MSMALVFLMYAATVFMTGGLIYRIAIYARTPAPLRIPTMPAPTTSGGVVLRMAREITVFESLFKSNKWLWLFGWVFHLTLLLVLVRHLRYVTEPVWNIVVLIQPLGLYAGFGMVAALCALSLRRLVLPRIRYISNPSDHLMLLLLCAISISGLLMRFVAHTDIVAAKAFVLGLIYFDWEPLPNDPLLILHLTLISVLMIVFPISKLLHAPGIFFSPTRNQVDDSRDKRHVAPWAAQADSK